MSAIHIQIVDPITEEPYPAAGLRWVRCDPWSGFPTTSPPCAEQGWQLQQAWTLRQGGKRWIEWRAVPTVMPEDAP